jgi:hypothetical protein
MAAPQQVAGGPALGGSAMYYAPPAGQEINMGAAFLANMVQQRTTDARMMLAARLKSMDRSGQQAALVELAKARNDVLQQMAANERSRTDAKVQHTIAMKDLVAARVDKDIAEIKASSDQNVAAMQVEEERRKDRQLSDQGFDILEDAQGAIDDAVRKYQAAGQLQGDARKAAMTQANQALLARLSNDANVARGLDPGDRAALADRLKQMNTSFPLNDQGTADSIKAAIGRAFPGEGTIPEARRGYKSSSFEDLIGDAVGTYGAIEQRFPAEQTTGGSQGSGSSTRGPAGPTGPSDDKLAEQLSAIDALKRQIEGYEPSAALGGIYDPYPGAGSPRRRPSSPAATREPKPQKTPEERVKDLLEEGDSASVRAPNSSARTSPPSSSSSFTRTEPAPKQKGSGDRVRAAIEDLVGSDGTRVWNDKVDPGKPFVRQGPQKPGGSLPADGTRMDNDPVHEGLSEELQRQLQDLGVELQEDEAPWNEQGRMTYEERKKRKAAR